MIYLINSIKSIIKARIIMIRAIHGNRLKKSGRHFLNSLFKALAVAQGLNKAHKTSMMHNIIFNAACINL